MRLRRCVEGLPSPNASLRPDLVIAMTMRYGRDDPRRARRAAIASKPLVTDRVGVLSRVLHRPLANRGNPKTPFPQKIATRPLARRSPKFDRCTCLSLSEKRRERRLANPALSGCSKLCRVSGMEWEDFVIGCITNCDDSEWHRPRFGMARCNSGGDVRWEYSEQGKGQKGGRRIELRP